MAVSLATLTTAYLAGAVAETVEGLQGILQHLQNFMSYQGQPSAKDAINIVMEGGTISIYADLHNAPSKKDMQKYTNSLGNDPGAPVVAGSNEKGHGGTAGFHSDAKVGLLGGKVRTAAARGELHKAAAFALASAAPATHAALHAPPRSDAHASCAQAADKYMLAFPLTSGMSEYMAKKPLILGVGAGQIKHQGKDAVNIIVYCQRTNALEDGAGKYETFIPEEEELNIDPAHYEHALKWLNGFLRSVGTSLEGAFAATFDKLKDTNGLCVHYHALQDHGFATQPFEDGVANDIVINVTPPLRLSHEIAKQFDVNALNGRQFRINGQVVDLRPLCPTAQPVIFGPFPVTVPGGMVNVTLHSNDDVDIADGAIVCKFGDLLLSDHILDDGLATIRTALQPGARFSGNSGFTMTNRSALTPGFLQMVLAAAGKKVEPGRSATQMATQLPQRLRDFVKEICELDNAQRTGLDWLRMLFGLQHAYIVVDVGRKFTTNSFKTGLFDPLAASHAILEKALIPLWIARCDALPANYAAQLAAFRKAKADKAAKAAEHHDKKAKAAKAAAQLGATGGAAGGAAGGDGAAQPGGRTVRAAAAAAKKRLGEDDTQPMPEPPPPPLRAPKRAKTAGGAAAPGNALALSQPAADAAALRAENDRLKAQLAALAAENARLRARLAALEGPAAARATPAQLQRAASREAALAARVAALEAQLQAAGIPPTNTGVLALTNGGAAEAITMLE